jgi:pSer/pThr/pTyr-binding forkhead associated (FHA) protein
MAYGRLDVFWPDGKIENISLKADNISIGRSPGNVIPLDTDSLSRYHVNIYRDAAGVFIQDMESANGTFVDGTRLQPNQPLTLSGGEEIQIGVLRMIFHRLDDSPTTQTSPVEDTQRIQRETRTFRMEVLPPPIAVAPCAYTSAEITIFNNGDKPEQYQVTITGLPNNWVRVSRPTLEVAPQESAVVVVNIKPLRRSDSTPGIYSVVAAVRPQSKASDVLEAPFNVTILPFSGFGLALGTPRVGMGDRFKLHVHNQGSAPLPVQVTGRSKAQNLQFILNPSQLTLNPGQRFQIIGEIRPGRRRYFGNAAEYPFDLVVQSMDNARFTVATTGHVLERPPLPVWGGVAAGVAGLFVLAVVLLGTLALLSRTPDPEIVSLSINNGSTQIAQGEPLILSWEAENADSITVRVNNQVVLQQQPPSAEGVVVNTQGFTGPLNISVVATRDGQTSEVENWTIAMTEPTTVAQLSISPQQLVRYVVQTATISYDMPGASNVNISGLQDVLQEPLPSVSGSSGEVRAVLLPLNDFTITLTADTDAETVSQETLNVQLIDPTCSAIGSQSVDLYAQPDAGAALATSVDPGERIVVNARSDDWLRFSPAGLTTDAWGQRNDFVCDSVFNVDNLREVDVEISLATRTRTPTIEAPIIVVPRTTTATPVTSQSQPIATPSAIIQQQAAPTSTTFSSGATALPPLPVTNPTVAPGVTIGVTVAASPSN